MGRLILPALERASGSEICSFTIRMAPLYSRHELCTQKLA
ncbi:Mobile element protein [Acetobacter orientalis]|uniref:Mobile element protein n=1 Tax=Acetobacter orientalis TaxID=146474 RepID=A0A2Z5ZJ32_9PROT|nr:Mobile element protein [Acetobacter orientalis]